MQRFLRTLFILSLSMLTGFVSLTLITASFVIVSHLPQHQPIMLPVLW